MFSVAVEEYNSVQAMVIALPGDIQPVAAVIPAVITVGMAGMAAIAILVVIVAAAVATGKRKLLY